MMDDGGSVCMYVCMFDIYVPTIFVNFKYKLLYEYFLMKKN